MKKIILIVLLCSLSIGSYAQRVYKEGEIFIIECKGMPEASYTKLSKPKYMGTTENGITGIHRKPANEKVAYKFEVAKEDVADTKSYSNALSACGDKGDKWRSPTQRELQLIWTMHEGLKKLDGFTPLDTEDYWSATYDISTDTKAYCVDFTNGKTYSSLKTSTYKYSVRCIRDITE